MPFLIADDSDAKMMLLEPLVKKAGITKNILKAKTTEEAKRVIDKHSDIDAAFIDYEMPSENGPAIIAYLKEKNPKALIALVTSSNSEKYENDAREAGAEAFICTSFPEEEVIQNLMHLLVEWKVELQD